MIATGADGYATVISAGEISPMFGNRQDLVATSDTGGTLPSPDGFARVVATGDVAGGRYVSNLTSLAVASAPVQAGTGGGPTTQVAVQGAVAAPLALTLPSLEALPSYTETVTYLAAGTPVTDTYTGALLWDVLNSAGIVTDPGIKNSVLRDLVTATGSDGYQVSFALGELSPSFGDAPILVAYSDTGGQLFGSAGFARVVVPGDSAGGRYVSNLASLTVFDGTAVPEPASLALLLAGLVFIGRIRTPWTSRLDAPRQGRLDGPLCWLEAFGLPGWDAAARPRARPRRVHTVGRRSRGERSRAWRSGADEARPG